MAKKTVDVSDLSGDFGSEDCCEQGTQKGPEPSKELTCSHA